MAGIGGAATRAVRAVASGISARAAWVAIALLWALAVVTPDILVGRAPMRPAYALALAGSLALWAGFVALLAVVRKLARRASVVVALLFAATMTVSVVGSLGYHRFFRKDVRSIEWEFVLENPTYAWTLTSTAMTWGDRAAFILAPLVLTACLMRLARLQRGPASLRLRHAAPLLGMAAAVGLYLRPLTADLLGFRAILFGTYAHLRDGGQPRTLPVPRREPAPRRIALRRPSVLLILHESLGYAESLHERGFTPKTAAFIEAHAGHAARFVHATTAATATCVSVPALLTGLHPEASRDDFARAPLAWHVARGLGYSSALLSAQEYGVEYFDQYFLGEDAPDVVRHAAHYVTTAPRVNELGVDDALVVDDAIELLGARRDGPLFLVVQFNGTHWPCWAPELPAVRWSGSMARGYDRDRCAAAARYVDAQTLRLLTELEKLGELEKTLVIGTSDHGEVFRPGRPMRRYSYYDDVLAIPFFVHLPATLPDEAAVLRQNAHVRVGNLDVFPTLLDLWGAWDPGAARPGIEGQSLLRPIPADRFVSAVTDSAISREPQGFAMFHGRWKWVVSELGGVELFDLESDPDELRDLSPHAPPEEVAAFRRELTKHPKLFDILEFVKASAPAKH